MRWLPAVILTLLLLVVIGLTLHSGVEPEADFTYAIGDSIKTLDPARMAWNEDIRIAHGLWEGLTSYDPCTLVPIPAAAQSWQISDDGCIYTFTLRPEASWSDGSALRAQDFIYGWRRAIEPGTAEDYAFLISDYITGMAEYRQWRNDAVRTLIALRDMSQGKTIDSDEHAFLREQGLCDGPLTPDEARQVADRFRAAHREQVDQRFSQTGVQALDDTHLQVTLVRPTGYFLELTAFSTFSPIHESIELLRLTDDPAARDLTLWLYDSQWVKPDYHVNGYPGLVTNGPFRLADWQFKRYMLFEQNPHYWDRTQVRSRHIKARIMPEAQTAFLAYERGELDWLSDLNRVDFAPELWQQGHAGQRDDIHHCLAYGTYYYMFNCLDHLPDGQTNPLADARVRLALNLAVDKQAIVEQVRRVGNPPAVQLVPPGSIAGYESPQGLGFDPERARRLLSEAGYDRATMPVLEILYNSGYGHDIPAQAVAEMWRQQLGIQVILKGKELKSFDDDRQRQNFSVCRSSWYGDYGDPTTFLDLFATDNGNNHGKFSHSPYDALLAQAADTLDPERRMALLAEAEAVIIQEQLPFLPLYHYVNLMAFRPNTVGLYPNARNLYLFKYLGKK